MPIPVVLQLRVNIKNGQTYLCQRARPAVVSSLTFQSSFVSAGSPFPKTVLLRSSKNRCAYSSSSFCSAAACARFEVLPEPRGVKGMAGIVGWASEVEGRLGGVVLFFGAALRAGVFATGGVALMGFFADFGGSLEWRSDQGKQSAYV
jgi:hypothetical protein